MNADYRGRLNAELPHYRAVHSAHIDVASRKLIIAHAVEYDDLLRLGHGFQWARAELRRRHRAEWRAILAQVPGTVRDVRNGTTVEEVREWTG